ncbi:MAG: hypothetical protein JSW71_22835 [Gemmatimonadota bacterium]|nr:MAG: hypothetical protein JSW71_22835 [Gemmatimonadota bacterium]
MSKGQEYIQQVQKALSAFEDAIVHREHKKLLESSVSVQQDVDRARQKVVDTVVEIVTKVRLNQ